LAGSGIVKLFLLQAVGGGLLGLVLGLLAVQLMRLVTDPHIDLVISLALATGTFSLADSLGMSGPIAVVVAGLALGARRSPTAISKQGQRDLQLFWSLVDEVLNTILFLLIGFEIVAVVYRPSDILAALIAIPLSIVVRAVSVVLSTILVRARRPERQRAIATLTWGGLRGGISVALALGLPQSDVRPTLLAVCYGVVVFTIVVQGLTIERLARWLYRKTER